MSKNSIDNQYIFKSKRLGFRNWIEPDYSKMARINSDPKVMEFFPRKPDLKQTIEFIERMQKQFMEKGFCYFAVDLLVDNTFIGFIGISEQVFKSKFTPCIDIGWRLDQAYWGKGYATEGALRCLDFAFDEMGLQKIKALCPVINYKSEKVMKHIGMKKVGIFNHPLLSGNKVLEKCLLYEIDKDNR